MPCLVTQTKQPDKMEVLERDVECDDWQSPSDRKIFRSAVCRALGKGLDQHDINVDEHDLHMAFVRQEVQEQEIATRERVDRYEASREGVIIETACTEKQTPLQPVVQGLLGTCNRASTAVIDSIKPGPTSKPAESARVAVTSQHPAAREGFTHANCPERLACTAPSEESFPHIPPLQLSQLAEALLPANVTTPRRTPRIREAIKAAKALQSVAMDNNDVGLFESSGLMDPARHVLAQITDVDEPAAASSGPAKLEPANLTRKSHPELAAVPIRGEERASPPLHEYHTADPPLEAPEASEHQSCPVGVRNAAALGSAPEAPQGTQQLKQLQKHSFINPEEVKPHRSGQITDVDKPAASVLAKLQPASANINLRQPSQPEPVTVVTKPAERAYLPLHEYRTADPHLEAPDAFEHQSCPVGGQNAAVLASSSRESKQLRLFQKLPVSSHEEDKPHNSPRAFERSSAQQTNTELQRSGVQHRPLTSDAGAQHLGNNKQSLCKESGQEDKEKLVSCSQGGTLSKTLEKVLLHHHHHHHHHHQQPHNSNPGPRDGQVIWATSDEDVVLGISAKTIDISSRPNQTTIPYQTPSKARSVKVIYSKVASRFLESKTPPSPRDQPLPVGVDLLLDRARSSTAPAKTQGSVNASLWPLTRPDCKLPSTSTSVFSLSFDFADLHDSECKPDSYAAVSSQTSTAVPARIPCQKVVPLLHLRAISDQKAPWQDVESLAASSGRDRKAFSNGKIRSDDKHGVNLEVSTGNQSVNQPIPCPFSVLPGALSDETRASAPAAQALELPQSRRKRSSNGMGDVVCEIARVLAAQGLVQRSSTEVTSADAAVAVASSAAKVVRSSSMEMQKQSEPQHKPVVTHRQYLTSTVLLPADLSPLAIEHPCTPSSSATASTAAEETAAAAAAEAAADVAAFTAAAAAGKGQCQAAHVHVSPQKHSSLEASTTAPVQDRTAKTVETKTIIHDDGVVSDATGDGKADAASWFETVIHSSNTRKLQPLPNHELVRSLSTSTSAGVENIPCLSPRKTAPQLLVAGTLDATLLATDATSLSPTGARALQSARSLRISGKRTVSFGRFDVTFDERKDENWQQNSDTEASAHDLDSQFPDTQPLADALLSTALQRGRRASTMPLADTAMLMNAAAGALSHRGVRPAVAILSCMTHHASEEQLSQQSRIELLHSMANLSTLQTQPSPRTLTLLPFYNFATTQPPNSLKPFDSTYTPYESSPFCIAAPAYLSTYTPLQDVASSTIVDFDLDRDTSSKPGLAAPMHGRRRSSSMGGKLVLINPLRKTASTQICLDPVAAAAGPAGFIGRTGTSREKRTSMPGMKLAPMLPNLPDTRA